MRLFFIEFRIRIWVESSQIHNPNNVCSLKTFIFYIFLSFLPYSFGFFLVFLAFLLSFSLSLFQSFSHFLRSTTAILWFDWDRLNAFSCVSNSIFLFFIKFKNESVHSCWGHIFINSSNIVSSFVSTKFSCQFWIGML